LRLRCEEELCVEVVDNGTVPAQWRPGVGLTAMNERAAELGGSCDVGPGPGGWHVLLTLPLSVS
jgi:signal transduction histidine kinase